MKVKVLHACAIVDVSQLVAGLARLSEIKSSLRIVRLDLLEMKYNVKI